MEPIQQLYNWLSSSGYIEGVPLDEFQADMANLATRKKLYANLSKIQVEGEKFGAAGLSEPEFMSKFFPQPTTIGKKKAQSDGGTEPSLGSSLSDANAQDAGMSSTTEPAVDETVFPKLDKIPDALAGVLNQPRIPVPQSQPSMQDPIGIMGDVAAARAQKIFQSPAFGTADPQDWAETRRQTTEKGYSVRKDRAATDPVNAGRRTMENIERFGAEAASVAKAADDYLKQTRGVDWAKQFEAVESAATYWQQNMPADPAQQQQAREALERYKGFADDPVFQRYLDASIALGRAEDSYSQAMRSDKTVAMRVFDDFSKQAQGRIDEYAKSGGAIGQAKLAGNWLVRNGAKVVAGVVAIPRLLSEAGDNDAAFGKGVAEALGRWADDFSRGIETEYPDTSRKSGSMSRRESRFKGLRVEVDENGNIENVRDKEGFVVSVDDKFREDFKAAGLPIPEAKFVGEGGKGEVAVKVGTSIADGVAQIFMLRGLGGGSKLGVAGTAFGMAFNDAYKEAMEDPNVDPEWAARYAAGVGAIQGGIEAYIGDIETKPIAQVFRSGRQIGSAAARAAAGRGVSPFRAAYESFKPVLKSMGEEQVEEFGAAAMEVLAKKALNMKTGASLDDSFTIEDAKELALTTAGATLVAGLGSIRGGRSRFEAESILTATRNQVTFQSVLDDLVEAGKMAGEEAEKAKQRIERLAAFAENLPEAMSDERKGAVLLVQGRRDALSEMSKDENVLPAQRQAAAQMVRQLDEQIAEIVSGQSAPEPARVDGKPVTEEEKAQHAEAIVEGFTEPSIAEIPVADGTAPLMPPVNALAEAINDPSVTVADAQQAWVETADKVAAGEKVAEVVTAALEQRGIEPTDKVVEDATNAVMETLVGTGDPTPQQNEPLGEAVQQTLDEHIAEAGIEPAPFKIETPDDHAAAFFAAGGRLSPKTAKSLGVSNAYSRADGVTLDKAAEAIAEFSPTGMTKKEARAALTKYLAANPTMDLMRHAKARAEEQKTASDSALVDVAVGDGPRRGLSDSVAQETMGFVERMMSGLDKKARAALENTVKHFETEDGELVESGRIEAAVAGRGDAVDMAVLQELEKSHPDAYRALVYGFVEQNESARPQGGDSQNEGAAQSEPSQTATEPDGTAQGGGQEPLIDNGTVATIVERAEAAATPQQAMAAAEEAQGALTMIDLPSATEAVLPELVANGDLSPVMAAAALSGDKALEDVGMAAAEESMDGLRQVDDVLAAGMAAEEQAMKTEAAEIRATGVAPTLRTPVITEVGNEIVVSNAADMRDIMRELGGEWRPGAGWVFPKSKRAAVAQALDRPANADASMQRTFVPAHDGFRISALLRAPAAYIRMHAIRRRIKKAKSVDEALRIAQEELHISGNENRARAAKAINRLAKAFPNIKVVTDPVEYAAAVARAKPKSGKRPAGFVMDGKVYLDIDRIGAETPIHEVGHIWQMWAKEHDQEMYALGVAAVRGSEYEAAVRESGDYDALDDDGIIDEAMALLIGERGAAMMDEGAWHKAQRFLSMLWNAVKGVFGVSNTMTTAEAGDVIAARLLSGEELSIETSERIAAKEKQAAKFMFVGERAQMQESVKSDLVTAKILDAQGWSNKDIFDATNWWRGVDGKWRWELDDSGVEIVLSSLEEMGDDDMWQITEVVSAPKLFAAYPWLAKTAVVRSSNLLPEGVAAGVADYGDGVMLIVVSDKLDAEQTRLKLLHEMQHLVQIHEMFAYGANGRDTEAIKAAIAAEEDVYRRTRMMAALQDGAARFYAIAAGEVESRNVESRADMSAAERRDSFPRSTMDVAAEEQVVFFGRKQEDALSQSIPHGFEIDSMSAEFDTPAVLYSFASDRVMEAARAGAAKTIIELEVARGVTDAPALVAKIAAELSMPPTVIAGMLDREQRRAGTKARKAKIGQLAAEELLKYGKAKGTAWFGFKKGLPQQMWDGLIRRSNRTNGILREGKFLEDALEKAIREEWGYEPALMWGSRLSGIERIWRRSMERSRPGAMKQIGKEATPEQRAMVTRAMQGIYSRESLIEQANEMVLELVRNNAGGVPSDIPSQLIRATVVQVFGKTSADRRAVVSDLAKFAQMVADAANKAMGGSTFTPTDAEGIIIARWTADVVAQRENLGRAIQEDRDMSTLPPKIQAAARDMRSFADALSKRMLLSGAVPRGTIVTVLDNMGVDVHGLDQDAVSEIADILAKNPYARTPEEQQAAMDFMERHATEMGSYLTRTYQVHRNKTKEGLTNWDKVVSEDVKNEAKAFLMQQWRSELDALAQAYEAGEQKVRGELAAAQQRLAKHEAMFNKALSKARADLAAAEAKLRGATGNMVAGLTAKRDAIAAKTAKLEDDQVAILEILGLNDDEIQDFEDVTGIDPDTLNYYARAILANRRQVATLLHKTTMEDEGKLKRMKVLANNLENADSAIETMIHEWGDDTTGVRGTRSEMGKDRSIFVSRKNIPEPIRKLMGEDLDPGIVFPITIWKMAHHVEAQELLSYLAANYDGILFSKGENRKPEHTVLYSGEGSKAFAPLNGYYTTPEILTAIRQMDAESDDSISSDTKYALFNLYRNLNHWVKTGLTVLSPASASRNFYGNIAFPFINGWNPLLAISKYNRAKRPAFKKAWYVELAQYGVTGKSVSLGDLSQKMDNLSADFPDVDNSRWTNLPKKLYEKAARIYQVGDEFYKVVAYEAEKSRYAKAWYGSDFDSLSATQQDEIRERASKIVRSTTPDYSYIPTAVKMLRNAPVFGTFMSFQTEVFRVSYNTFKLAQAEMRDKRTAAIGVGRMARLFAWRGFVHAMQYSSMWMFGIGFDEDEESRQLLPEYEQLKTTFYTAPPDGRRWRTVNLSYADPFNFLDIDRLFWPDVMASVGIGKPGQKTLPEKLRFAASDLTSTYLDWNLLTKTMAQVFIANKKDTGGPIYFYEGLGPFDPLNRDRTTQYLQQKLQPGISKVFWDAYFITNTNGMTPQKRIITTKDAVLNDVFGWKVTDFDPLDKFLFAVEPAAQLKEDSREDYNKTRKEQSRLYESYVRAGASEQALAEFDEKARALVSERYKEVEKIYMQSMQDAMRYVVSARAMRLSEDEIRQVLADKRFNAKEREYILSGGKTPLVLTFKEDKDVRY